MPVTIIDNRWERIASAATAASFLLRNHHPLSAEQRHSGTIHFHAQLVRQTVAIRRLGEQAQTVLPLDEAIAALVAEATPPDLRR